MAKKVKDTDFVFASLRIKVIETRLLGPADIDRMIDARSDEDIAKLLSDKGYEVPGQESGYNAEYFNRLISEETRKNAETLESLGDVGFLTTLFMYQHDYHNLKVFIKSEGSDRNPERMLIESGTLPLTVIRSAVRERDYSELTPLMAEGCSEAIEAYDNSHDAQEIDIILDNYCLREIKEAAKRTNVDFVYDYFCAKIDLINIQSFFRLKKMDKPREFARKVIMVGGHIPAESFITNYEQTVADFAVGMSGTGYAELLVIAVEMFDEVGGMARIGLICDNYLDNMVRRAIKIPFGPEVVAGYAILKENELQTIRVVISGRGAGLESDEIKRRLRSSYV